MVHELVEALNEARDLLEALVAATTTGQPPDWLVEDAQKALARIDELLARLGVAR